MGRRSISTLAQLSRDAVKMTEQSTLLLLAFAEHLTVLRERETGKAATSVARNDSSES
jgi:hypothetical protein